MSTRAIAVPEAVPATLVRGAAEAVRTLRTALVAEDVASVQASRWLAPRPPGERDLLSDMAAGEGIATAVHRLSKFWRRGEVRLERIRAVSIREAEVYERIDLPSETIGIVSVVRRESERHPWQVVCTNEAKDERTTVWVSVRDEVLDDVAYSLRPDAEGQLLMDGERGVLGHSERGWLAHVRGPFVPDEWPESLPGSDGQIVEIVLGLSNHAEDRAEQLQWLMRAAFALLDELGGDAAYLPDVQRLVLPDALVAAGRGQMLPRHAFAFWARVEEIGDHLVSHGLSRLGLPEIEAAKDVLRRPERVGPVLERFAATVIAMPSVPTLGTELVVDDECLVLEAGRRGPRRGTSYGRFGAFALVEADPRVRRGSHTRIRIPVD